MNHPSPQALAALGRGELSAEESAPVQEHLGSCSECSLKLFELSTSGGAGEEHTRVSGSAPGPALPKLERGAAIGRYVVLDVLGEGGMGVVYAAWDPELDRKVAIKLLQAAPGGPDTSMGQSWLLREAQALAKLSHPNVIAVHDVGSMGGDRVFVAMELVDGKTLRAWLKEPRPTREIVEVFRAAGEGLAAAHAAGLIHRDFKPDNVLVGQDGRVRVMDFGLARSTGGAAPAAAPIATLRESALTQELTQHGAILGTPAYMAPELYAGGAADPRTDQFAFGVSLFEALYGARPFSRPYRERPEGGKWRIEEPAGGPRVPGWLREIAQKALAEKREDRFASMGELLAALGNDPAVRRKRWALGAAAVVAVAALVGGVRAVSVRQNQLCRGADQKLAGLWDEPTRQQIQAAFRATGSPLADDLFGRVSARLDGYARDWVSMRTDACEATRIRGEQTEEALGLRMECLDQRLLEVKSLTQLLAHADDKAVTKAVQAAYNLGDLASCSDVAALRSLVKPPNAAVRGQVEALRAELAAAKALYDTGKSAEAEKRARPAVAQADALNYRPIAAEAHFLLGVIMDGKSDTALDEYAQAMWQAEAGRDDDLFAMAAARRVHLAANLRNFAAAEAGMALAEAALDRIGNPIRARLQYTAAAANLLTEKHQPEKGIELAREGVERAKRDLPADDPAIASAWNVYGKACGDGQHLRESIAAYLEAIKLRERVLGPSHPDTGIAYMNLGATEEDEGLFAQSVEHGEKAQAIFRATLGPQSVLYGVATGNLAEAREGLGQFEQARKEFEEALAVTAPLGPQNDVRCGMFEHLVQTDLELGDVQRFRADVVPTVACRQGTPATDPDGARVASYQAAAELEASPPRDVVPALEQAVQVLSKQTGRPLIYDLGLAQFTLARALAAKHERARGQELAAQAKASFVAAKRPYWPEAVDRWLAQQR